MPPTKPIRIAINGFGRIGRAAFKIALENPKFKIVAINDLTDNKTIAHLLKYDSVYGPYPHNIDGDDKYLYLDQEKIISLAEKDPAHLPWQKLAVDVVLECTGHFVNDGAFLAHLKAGAKKVILSAPSKGKPEAPTYLMGVNDEKYHGEKAISNASCTTNSIAPVTAVIDANFKVKQAFLTTVHSYTADQNLVDGPHKDLRRARAAAFNIVPTTTGATLAVTKIIPKLKNKFDGVAIRVPTICGSISDLTFLLGKNVTVAAVNNALKKASHTARLKHILAVSNDPLVSSDIIGSSYSSIVDLPSTQVLNGKLVKILTWYDNEWGYACRLIEMAAMMMKK